MHTDTSPDKNADPQCNCLFLFICVIFYYFWRRNYIFAQNFSGFAHPCNIESCKNSHFSMAEGVKFVWRHSWLAKFGRDKERRGVFYSSVGFFESRNIWGGPEIRIEAMDLSRFVNSYLRQLWMLDFWSSVSRAIFATFLSRQCETLVKISTYFEVHFYGLIIDKICYYQNYGHIFIKRQNFSMFSESLNKTRTAKEF